MNYLNANNVADQLRSAGLMLETATNGNGGALVGELYVGSTKSVRVDVAGSGKKKSGAYKLHELRLDDGILICGAYWLDHGSSHFILDLNKECAGCGADDVPLKAKTCPHCGEKQFKRREVTEEQLAAHKKRMAELQREAAAEAQRKADRAAAWADAVWRACKPIANVEQHDYLVKKQLTSAHTARLFESREGIVLDGAEASDYQHLAQYEGALVVPLLNIEGNRRGLQFILSREKHRDLIKAKERDKDYWPQGIQNDGLHFLIPGATGPIIVAEGFATAASIAEASGLRVAVAFAANNVGKVGEAIWCKSKKRARLLYAADDDLLQRCVACGKITPVETHLCQHCGAEHKKHNAGVDACSAAAVATNGAWVKPAFAARAMDKKGDTDFNDLHVAEGIQAVSAQIRNAIDAAGWAEEQRRPTRGAEVPPQGGGEKPPLAAQITIDDAVERFALIYGGNGTLFDFHEHMLVPKADVLDILPGRAWDKLKEAAGWRAYRLSEVGFDPTGKDAGIKCNLYGGWPTTPKAGKCDALLDLLEHLCSAETDNRDLFDFVLKWFAYPLQHPGAKMKTALVFHGPEGVGKNLWCETVMAMYGEYGRIINQDAIDDKHNDWASRKLYLIADEVVARQELFHVKNKLKGLITGDWIRINPKNITAHDERNHVNIVFLSNEIRPLVLSRDDRRYAVVWTPAPRELSFYDAVRDELESGGRAALHDYLLHIPLGDFNEHSKPPMTQAKRDLIEQSLSPQESFIEDWKSGNVVLDSGHDAAPLPFIPCLGTDLFAAYQKDCKRKGIQYPGDLARFIGTCGKQPGWKAAQSIGTYTSLNDTKTKNRKLVVPSLADITTAQKNGVPTKLPEGSDKAWLTECFFAFAEAMEGHR